ncbi:MAG: CsbD family protein [Okeania sp. SIO2D1]|nr:CsbD family protein [Okeania sp. SIO2D1]
MTTEDRVQATLKNVEGKAQEMMGEVTGNPEDKAEGQVKQGEAKAEHVVENAKDEAKKAID